MPYCTKANVENELLGIDLSSLGDLTAYIVGKIDLKEKEINRRTSDVYSEISTSSYMNGSGCTEMVLRHTPILEITECKLRVAPSIDWYTFMKPSYINVIDSSGIEVRTPSTDAVVHACDLLVDCTAGILSIPPSIALMTKVTGILPFWNYTWMIGIANVYINWKYGYSTAPLEIQNLCAKMVAIEVLGRLSDKMTGGVVSISVDGFGKNYGNILYEGRIRMLMEECVIIIESYKRIGIN